MKYHPDDFLRLMEHIESVGGTLLPEPCRPRKFKLKQPNKQGDLKWTNLFTTGCGREARFAVPYNVPAGKRGDTMKERGGGIVIACAVDDDIGKWPRFSQAIEEDSY